MTDDEIRRLIRDAIARHLGGTAESAPGTPVAAGPPAIPMIVSRYHLPRAADDVMCLIEPSVKCNHCGYCLCHGH